MIVECIKNNPKYITDIKDPNAQDYMGVEWYQAQLDYYNFQATIDYSKYGQPGNEDYTAQIDQQSQELLQKISEVIPD
mgnify:CR=1